MGHKHYQRSETKIIRILADEYRKSGENGPEEYFKKLVTNLPERPEMGLRTEFYKQLRKLKGMRPRKVKKNFARIGIDGRKITPQGLRKMSETAKKNNEVRLQQLRARIRAVTGATEDQVERILNPRAPKLALEQVQSIEAALVAQDSALYRFTARQDGTVEVVHIDVGVTASFRNGLRPEEKMDKLAEMVAKA